LIPQQILPVAVLATAKHKRTKNIMGGIVEKARKNSPLPSTLLGAGVTRAGSGIRHWFGDLFDTD